MQTVKQEQDARRDERGRFWIFSHLWPGAQEQDVERVPIRTRIIRGLAYSDATPGGGRNNDSSEAPANSGASSGCPQHVICGCIGFLCVFVLCLVIPYIFTLLQSIFAGGSSASLDAFYQRMRDEIITKAGKEALKEIEKDYWKSGKFENTEDGDNYRKCLDSCASHVLDKNCIEECRECIYDCYKDHYHSHWSEQNLISCFKNCGAGVA